MRTNKETNKDRFVSALRKSSLARPVLEALRGLCEPAPGEEPREEIVVNELIADASRLSSARNPARPLDQRQAYRKCVALFREFETAHLGQVVEGRHGHPTRFRFSTTGESPCGSTALWQALREMQVAPPYWYEEESSRAIGVGSGNLQNEAGSHQERPRQERPRKEEIVSQLRSRSEDLRRLGLSRLELFGSFARDEARPDSDVDLLATFDGGVTSEAFFEAKFLLEDLLGRRVDLVSEAALRDRVRASIEPELIRVA